MKHTLTTPEMRELGFSEKTAKEYGYIIVGEKVKYCKNCGKRVDISDFCDSSCALDYLED